MRSLQVGLFHRGMFLSNRLRRWGVTSIVYDTLCRPNRHRHFEQRLKKAMSRDPDHFQTLSQTRNCYREIKDRFWNTRRFPSIRAWI